jgi:hypothetical protein
VSLAARVASAFSSSALVGVVASLMKERPVAGT